MSPRHHQILAAIRRDPDASLAELATAIGLRSRSNAHQLVGDLEREGLIRRLPGRVRSIEIVGATFAIPLCGTCGAATASDRARACTASNCGVPGVKGVVGQHVPQGIAA